MQRYRYVDHIDRRGANSIGRVEQAKPNYAALVRENIFFHAPATARDEDLAFEALKGWLESPGHRANLIAQDVAEMDFGVAIAESLYVVQMLARPYSR